MTTGSVIRVAINAPLSRLFDYLPPDDGKALPGCRVLVPFGRGLKIGMVMELGAHSDVPVSKLKKSPRNYVLLEELFAKPRTSYLTKLRNPNPEWFRV